MRSFSDAAPGSELPNGWEPWTLSRPKKPTQYKRVDESARTVVKASADNTGENVRACYGDIAFRRIAPPRTVYASD